MMGEGKQLAVIGAAIVCLYLFGRGVQQPQSHTGMRAREAAAQSELAEEQTERSYTTRIIRAPAASSPDWEETFFAPSQADAAVEMTIPGAILLKNETSYSIDPWSVVESGTAVRLAANEPQILIIHTHSSEAYTPAGLDRYEPSDNTRTEDSEHNVIRIGDELARLYELAGLHVIHDRGVYDYPSYTGSYSRSGAAVEKYLRDYPSLSVVLDIHRDALGTDDVIYKTVAEETGTCASQAMLLVGTDESGLAHPNWRENLSLALYLQNVLAAEHPTLMRPVALVPQRYNQQLCGGMLILEVGSSGNTMQEALAAVRLFAASTAPALLALEESAA